MRENHKLLLSILATLIILVIIPIASPDFFFGTGIILIFCILPIILSIGFVWTVYKFFQEINKKKE